MAIRNELQTKANCSGADYINQCSVWLLWLPDLMQPAMNLANNTAPMGLLGGALPFAVLSVYLANINRAFGDVSDGASAMSRSDQQ
eukprot:scaffold672128_cov34-Prasinocladus_malaysianus.AAC.1